MEVAIYGSIQLQAWHAMMTIDFRQKEQIFIGQFDGQVDYTTETPLMGLEFGF